MTSSSIDFWPLTVFFLALAAFFVIWGRYVEKKLDRLKQEVDEMTRMCDEMNKILDQDWRKGIWKK